MRSHSISGGSKVTVCAALFCAVSNAAVAAPDKAVTHNAAYEHCLAGVKHDAARALTEAEQWSASGGGAASLDCAALALVQLRRYDEAAQALENAARLSRAGAANAALLDQAGNAWLLAGDTAKAAS